MAVGIGFDIHAFGDSGSLRLGGIDLEFARGVQAHSDGDVVVHAIVDALLGAMGAGDIGTMFPDDAEKNRDRDSMEFLDETLKLVADADMRIVNIDCTVALEQPKLAPHREKIVANLTSAVGAPVFVKAKRAEGMGAIGRLEGVACWAVVQLEPKPDGALS